jgi:hypothetical protein
MCANVYALLDGVVVKKRLESCHSDVKTFMQLQEYSTVRINVLLWQSHFRGWLELDDQVIAVWLRNYH